VIKVISRLSFYISVLYTLFPISSQAQDQAKTLVTEKMCYACHQQASASIGPPWQAIAARHGARKQVMTDVLAGKIIRGGGGSWGLIPMVPNQRVSEEEARVLAAWILEQAP